MGGYHITGRRTTSQSYYALNSLFRVPDIAKADYSTHTHPEFIYNFQRTTSSGQYFGIDIGLGYGFDGEEGKWCLFGLGGTALVRNVYDEYGRLTEAWYQNPEKFYLTPGSTVMFAVIVDQSSPRATAILKTGDGSNIIASYDFPMQYNPWLEMKKGCSIVRETLLASNSSYNSYINCGAMFKFAKWYRGTLTKVSGSQPYEQFNGEIISPRADKDNDNPNGYLDRTRMRTYCVPEYWDYQPTPFGCECASAGFTPNFENRYYDFPDVNY